MNLYEAIFVRKSVRNYCFDTLPPQTLDKIWEHYKEMPALFSGIGVDMAILDNRKGQERMLSMFSVKAPYYMAFLFGGVRTISDERGLYYGTDGAVSVQYRTGNLLYRK